MGNQKDRALLSSHVLLGQPGQRMPSPKEDSHSGTMPGRRQCHPPGHSLCTMGSRGGRGSGADMVCRHCIPPLPSYRGGPKGVTADGSNLKQPLRVHCWQPPACGSILYNLLWTPSLLGSEPSSVWPHTRLGAHGGMGLAAGEAVPGGAERLPLFK